MSRPAIRGLYAIADTALIPETDLANSVALALSGGARVIQYRDKSRDRVRRRHQAAALAQRCREARALFIVNDDVELAADVAADGVHVGRADAGVEHARQRAGGRLIVGVSCYDSLERARVAQSQGADYVAFGSFFLSPTKPHAVPADISLLAQARRALTIPLVAIGGITPENGARLVAAGADALAVISGVFGADDIHQAARRYAQLFDTGSA